MIFLFFTLAFDTETENPKMRGGYSTLGMVCAIGYMRGLAENVAEEGSRTV